MPLLTKRKQVGVAIEAVAGTAATIAAAQADFLALEATMNLDVEQFDRDFVRSSITRLKGIAGQKAATMNFGMELKGTTAGTFAAGAPNFGTLLQSAGFFQQNNVDTFSFTAIAGWAAWTGGPPFRHGERVNFDFVGGSGQTQGFGTLIHDTHDGAATMYVHTVTAPIAGTAHTSFTVTGQDSGAVASNGSFTVIANWTSSYSADQAISWWPISDVQKTVAIDGVIDNAPAAGDVIEGQTSGARGIFVQTNGTASMTFRPIRGAFGNGEVLQNLTQAVKYSDSNAAAAEAFTQMPTVTGELYEDGIRTRLVGGRTNVSFNMEVNRPVRMDFETRGVFSSAVDAPLLTGINYDFATPPLWVNTALSVGGNESGDVQTEASEVSPCLNSLSLDLGNTLADRKCVTAAGGLIEVIISQREGSGSLDPEATLESDIAWLGELQSGDVQRFRMTVGSAAGNQFYITMPGVQYESSSAADRDGILTRDTQFKLTGGNLHNLVASPTVLNGTGGDNETVITYITTG